MVQHMLDLPRDVAEFVRRYRVCIQQKIHKGTIAIHAQLKKVCGIDPSGPGIKKPFRCCNRNIPIAFQPG